MSWCECCGKVTEPHKDLVGWSVVRCVASLVLAEEDVRSTPPPPGWRGPAPSMWWGRLRLTGDLNPGERADARGMAASAGESSSSHALLTMLWSLTSARVE